MIKMERRSCVVVASLLLTACGGGGGGGSSTPNPNPPANRAPTIAAASFTTAEDTDLSGQLTVADADGDALTLTSANGPTLGTIVSLSNTGALVYRPNANASGDDSFVVTVSDGRGGTASATVSITITPVNDEPTIADASFTVAEDTDLSGQLTIADADGDALTLTSANGPTLGTIVSLSSSGAFVYRPNPNAYGADSFDVTVDDGDGDGMASATVNVTITPVDDAPVATNDEFAVAAAEVDSLDVLANDVDPDGGAVTVTLVGSALVGTAAVNSDNTIRIDGLPAGFRGLTRFTYRVAGSQGPTSTATAVVFVDTEPFRAVFSLNADNVDSDLVISDFSGEPRVLVAGNTSDVRLSSYIPSRNGAIVAFVRANPDSFAESEELCFVRVQGADDEICPPIPEQLRLTNYAVSPDGRWIAAGLQNDDETVASSSLLFVDTENPTGLVIDIELTSYVTDPRFSADSQHLYFKASDIVGPAALAVFRLDVDDPTDFVQLSADDPGSRITGYVVSNDDSRIIVQRSGGSEGFYLIEYDAPETEYPLSQPIDPSESFFGMSIVPLSADGTRIAYLRSISGQPLELYVAEVSTTMPNPRLQYTYPPNTTITALPQIRPDSAAVLVAHRVIGNFASEQVVESLVDGAATPVAAAATGRYDDSGDRIVSIDVLASDGPNRFYVADRADFSAPVRLGPTNTYNLDLNNPADLSRGVVLAGVSSSSSAEPPTYSPMLFNLSTPSIFYEISERDVRNSAFLIGERLHLVDAP